MSQIIYFKLLYLEFNRIFTTTRILAYSHYHNSQDLRIFFNKGNKIPRVILITFKRCEIKLSAGKRVEVYGTQTKRGLGPVGIKEKVSSWLKRAVQLRKCAPTLIEMNVTPQLTAERISTVKQCSIPLDVLAHICIGFVCWKN